MSLHNVISTGRGGAGNMFSSNDVNNSANEIIMTQEEFERYNNNGSNDIKKENIIEESHHLIEEDKMYNHDKKGHIIASSGRGGAGNIGKFDKLPSPKVKSDLQEIELSPVFSTGRGGVGNIYKTKSQAKTKINLTNEIDDQLSPLHSNRSNKSTCSNRRNSDSNNEGNIMKKIRKFFK
ncbi:hypothetical protein C6P42_000199 [Pichia californica]|nr:hypothetical protein C6P42_000199 [[Candida] californica]